MEWTEVMEGEGNEWLLDGLNPRAYQSFFEDLVVEHYGRLFLARREAAKKLDRVVVVRQRECAWAMVPWKHC